jgi:cytochrome c peroxidase
MIAPYLSRGSWGLLFILVACQSDPSQLLQEDSVLDAKLALGQHLFFEKRLSASETKSCGGCHDPKMAFSDGYRRSPGIYGDLHPRNTPGLLNLRSQHYFNRANPEITSVSAQMDGPLFGENPIEMGLKSNDTTVLRKLSNDNRYRSLFKRAYPGFPEPVSWPHIKESLEKYVLSLDSFNSPYDRYEKGEENALSASAKSGASLFFSSKYRCSSCHQPPLFGATREMAYEDQFANIGLYNYENGNYPFTDQGLFAVTKNEKDKGRFKIPSLRNLLFTAPYFHDGSAERLEQVLDVYAEGGRNVTYGNWQGDGRKNPNKHPLIQPFAMNLEEKYQLLDFLASLTDSTILSNPHFLSPFSGEIYD